MHGQKSAIKAALPLPAAALVTLLLLSVYFFCGTLRGMASLAAALAEAGRGAPLLPLPEGRQEPVTFLVFGIDAGEWVGGRYRPGPGRADTIVLIKAYPADNTAALLSIPRDTLAEIPGRPGDDKINHAYAFGQTALLREAVERFTGVGVDYYVGLNYRVFKDIVDLLGGVEFDVDRVITAYGLRLEKGLQVLDGDAAFALVTTRQDPLGDIDRVKRQQRFIKAVWLEGKKRPADEHFYLLLAAWSHLDTNLRLMDAVELFHGLREIKEADVREGIVPGSFYNRDGISYWKPDRAETGRLIRELFGGPEGEGGGRP
jgi:LCP family protein required for cell wall assembly